MTVAATSSTARNDYTGNGTQTSYAFTFEVLNESNSISGKNYSIKVILTENGLETEQVEDTNYTVTYNSDTRKGTVDFVVAPTTLQTITLLSDVTRSQVTDYINIGTDKFPANSHEETVDKLTLIAREQDEEIGRSILLPESSQLSGVTIPVSTANAGKFITVNGDGNNLTASEIADTTGSAVSTFMKTVLDDESSEAAINTLKSGLTSITSLEDADELIVGDSSDSNNSKKITKVNLQGSLSRLENLLINGDMEISQRGTSFTSVSNGDYTLDRWSYGKDTMTGSMVHTITRNTDTPTFAQAGRLLQNSIKVDCTTIDSSIAAGDYSGIEYKIEGYDFAEIAQKNFTLAFWAKATKTGTYCIGFKNSTSDRSYVAEYTIDTTDTWEYKTITVSASPSDGTWDYTNGRGLVIVWSLATGSTYQTTAGSWQTGNFFATSNQVNACDSTDNNFQITGVQMVKGSSDAEFKRRPFEEELALCQRYYEKSYSQGTNPATATSVGQVTFKVGAATTDFVSNSTRFLVTKRVSPSITLYDRSGNSGKVSYDNPAADNQTGSAANISNHGFVVNTDNSTSKSGVGFHYTADSEL